MRQINFFIVCTIYFCAYNFSISAQTSSRNGYWLHNKDTIRVFLVFAEISDYAWDTLPDPG